MELMQKAYEALRERVLALRDSGTGVWTGELASSALGTALAVSALEAGVAADLRLAVAGAAWLDAHANADGGWGDTPESVSNLSTTLIATAALRRIRRVRSEGTRVSGQWSLVSGPEECRDTYGSVLSRAEEWVAARAGSLEPEAVARALGQVYGKDRTFAVPILAFLAMCGEDERAWLSVPPLPFLLALLPQGLYRFFRLQVVSYALPALIAVGLCRHVCAARARGGWAWGRLFAEPLLKRLASLQPAHGGYLDAIPLTAFVCLALRHAGYGEHPVAQKGLAFLRQAARPDGSWAIDSNLRTWVTSLATRGVASELGVRSEELGVGDGDRGGGALERIAEWLVRTQVKERHPFTGAAPGGWAWTDLPGGVPDADDTSGALLALRRLKDAGCKTDTSGAVRGGVRWLLELQNADGGMPTFCRGWGKLPFDRSCPDISAHALAALIAWREGGVRSEELGVERGALDARKAVKRLIRYLERAQEKDGSWVPLWFGHQEAADRKNPVVGTARVADALRAALIARREIEVKSEEFGVGEMLARGEEWLLRAQKSNGGWSAGSTATVEETALAVIALTGGGAACGDAVRRGCAWLAENWEAGAASPAPLGLYFALLWYHEKMYPLVWALEALGRNAG
jgi:squalene-hopene/tetraprenyl-beta-curcumene cyclase